MLLREVSNGRLALNVDGLPEIFPLNFAVDHETVVFRTAEGSKAAAAENAPAALEADGYYTSSDTFGARGEDTVWSVVVKGTTTTIDVTSDLMAAVKLELHPWEAGRKDRFMRLMPDSITGRSFTPIATATNQIHSNHRHFSS